MSTSPDGRATMTQQEVATALGVCVASVQRNPPVPPIKVGKRVLFPRQAILDLLGGSGPAIRTAATR